MYKQKAAPEAVPRPLDLLAQDAILAELSARTRLPNPREAISRVRFVEWAFVIVGRALGLLVRWTSHNSVVLIGSSAAPARAGHIQMPKNNNSDTVTAQEQQRWLRRRDAHRARIQRDPAIPGASEGHVDVAVLQEWLDGNISNEYIEEYMRSFGNCEHCAAAYEYYKNKSGVSGRS